MTPRSKYIMEVGLPLLSVSMLIGVTVYVTFEAVSILLRKKSVENVDIAIMYGFASVNLLVDIICTALFHIRGKDIFQNVAHDDESNSSHRIHVHKSDYSVNLGDGEASAATTKNLNMISAFFHIGGDTLRTIAIFAAALVSSTTNWNPDYCDAWAAIVVSITILFLAVPMLYTIFRHMPTLSFRPVKDESLFTAVPVTSSDSAADDYDGLEMAAMETST